jgi:hypothetical protein
MSAMPFSTASYGCGVWRLHRRRACAILQHARSEQRLHGFELGWIDDRRYGHFNDRSARLTLAHLPELGIEAMATDVSHTRQHLVDGADT